MTLIKIRFKREIDSNYEYGLFIEPTDVIIDSKGNVIEGLVYDFDREHFDFCINLNWEYDR